MEENADDDDDIYATKIPDDADKKSSIFTPKAKKSLLNLPRTPTPFKNALDEIRKIRGETYVPSSPNGLVEDITEIMNKEKEQDNTVDSVYETDCSNITQTQAEQTVTSNPKRLSFDDISVSNGPNPKKAKKSLDTAWSNTTTTTDSKDLPYIVETPVSISESLVVAKQETYRSQSTCQRQRH